MFMYGGVGGGGEGRNGEAHLFFAVGSNKYQQSKAKRKQTGVIVDKLDAHQETGTLVFPLVTMQFFSSGLIMVGLIVRKAEALTIGRDLNENKKSD